MSSGVTPSMPIGGVQPRNAAMSWLIALNGPGYEPGPPGACISGINADSVNVSSNSTCQCLASWVAYAMYGAWFIAAPEPRNSTHAAVFPAHSSTGVSPGSCWEPPVCGGSLKDSDQWLPPSVLRQSLPAVPRKPFAALVKQTDCARAGAP